MGRAGTLVLTQQQRLLLKLARDFIAIPNCNHQEELVLVACALADAKPSAERRPRQRIVWLG